MSEPRPPAPERLHLAPVRVPWLLTVGLLDTDDIHGPGFPLGDPGRPTIDATAPVIIRGGPNPLSRPTDVAPDTCRPTCDGNIHARRIG